MNVQTYGIVPELIGLQATFRIYIGFNCRPSQLPLGPHDPNTLFKQRGVCDSS